LIHKRFDKIITEPLRFLDKTQGQIRFFLQTQEVFLLKKQKKRKN